MADREEALNDLALFAGAGGGVLANHILGDRTVCAVERDAYAALVLAQRQNDGLLPPFPIWSDVCTFDGTRWRGIVDCVSGGFPCQDISIAGAGAGLEGERSGLWVEFARIIREVEPVAVRVENSPMLASRGLGRILGDLSEMGFDAEWGVVSAADLGAWHERERIWVAATHPDRQRQRQQTISREGLRLRSGIGLEDDADARRARLPAPWQEPPGTNREYGRRPSPQFSRWPIEPGLVRMVHGMAGRVDRIKALGNGQVPRVAAAAFSLLAARKVTEDTTP